MIIKEQLNIKHKSSKGFREFRGYAVDKACQCCITWGACRPAVQGL